MTAARSLYLSHHPSIQPDLRDVTLKPVSPKYSEIAFYDSLRKQLGRFGVCLCLCLLEPLE